MSFGKIHQVQPRLAALAAYVGGLGAGGSGGVVDPLALPTSKDLYKSFSVCAEDRKYFSGASGIKISDNENAPSLLRNPKIGA